jgi:hypothetical protein
MFRSIILDLFGDIAELVAITIFLTGLMAILMGL